MANLVTLWFDKDGVLAKYDYSLYEGEYGAPAPWLVHNAHVYRNLEPYENMCKAVRNLYAQTNNVRAESRFCNVRVLTSVSDGITLAEHVIDGAAWCLSNVGIQSKDFYACAVQKQSIPIGLRSEIKKTDVLLDDYKPNLLKWQAAGGTAVKVVNGINSISDDYPCVHVDWDANSIYNALKHLVMVLQEGQTLDNGSILPFV